MSFTFKDLCRCSDADFALLHRRTDDAAFWGRTYELPCRLPPSCIPQNVLLGFWRKDGQYTVYTRPLIICRSANSQLSSLLVPPQLVFSSFAALTTHLRQLGQNKWIE